MDTTQLRDALLGYQVPEEDAQFSYPSLTAALAAADEQARTAKYGQQGTRSRDFADFERGLWDEYRNYMAGAKAMQPKTVAEAGEMALGAVPIVGNAMSARDAYDAAKQGDWGAATAGAVGAIPFIGGIFAGPMAKTANKAMLKRAEEMAAAGAKREDIWRNTGWFKGVDDKWRFEIPDNEAAFNARAMTGPREARIGYAEEVATHPYLYSAYPEMKNIPIAEEAGPNLGAYHPGGYIELNLAEQKDRKQRLSTTLHELQHGVQEDEGFARGGNLQDIPAEDIAAERARLQVGHDAMIQRLAERYKRLGIDVTPGRSLQNPGELADQELANRLYARLAGEVEARNVQARRNMTPMERRETPPWVTEDVPSDQQLVRMGGGSASMATADAPKDYASILAGLGDNWKNAPVIGADGTVLYNPLSRQSLGGPAVFLHPDGGVRKGIIAYHGSPHDFDRFDMSKIGTGEGAQAYGHGLYFAEAEPVARKYRDKLAQTVKAGTTGQWVTAGASNLTRQLLSANGADIDRTIAKAQENVAAGGRLGRAYAHVPDELQAIKDAGPKPPAGRMYEVNIAADPDHFLDWDKNFFAQNEKIKDILLGIGVSPGRALPYAARRVSEVVADHFGGAQEAADALRQAGIPGIKYLDQGSRSAGEGSRNYVVFDDALISVVRKYGIPGAIAMGLLTQEQGDAMAAQGF